MRILVLGATDLSIKILNELHETGFNIVGVIYLEEEFSISYENKKVTNTRHANIPDWANKNQIPAYSYTSNDDIIEIAQKTAADFLLVAGWYFMVPNKVRTCFPYGAGGLHASLLPKYRGGAPLNWALLNRETVTGISFFELSDGVDDGLLYGQKELLIKEGMYIGELVENSIEAAVSLLKETLPLIASRKLTPQKQVGEPSYSLQRNPSDGVIDWKDRSDDIELLVRAVSQPYPGARAFIGDEEIVIWKAKDLGVDVKVFGANGQILVLPEFDGILVKCGHGILQVHEATTLTGECFMAQLKKKNQQRFSNGLPK